MKLLKYFVIILSFSSFAQSENYNNKDSVDLESLYYLNDLETKTKNLYNYLAKSSLNQEIIFNKDSIPFYNDSILNERLIILDENSPFELISNESTLKAINVYAKKRKYIARMQKSSKFYFPLFEQNLSKYDLPYELKYLPIVESALNPVAKSRAGARGLWQFMPPTGRMMGLKISSFVDERCDPYLSTDAACNYLSRLYKIYNDWSLALAAYNAGPGNVNKAIRRSGGKKTYWEIREFLPRETQNYVPIFVAINYIMSYSKEHNVQIINPEFTYYDVDTVHVCDRIEFDKIEEWICYDKDKIAALNPMFLKDIIPKPENTYSLVLPSFLIGDFIENEDSIAKYSSLTYQYSLLAQSSTTVEKTETIDKSEVYYTIKNGDTLWDIAQLYKGISADDIQKLNSSINVHRLKAGDVIKIYR